ncbi:hypothetical protein QIG27_27455, partial [Klebsiella pneumoniae]|nr:hypothetical protein [Klebsiella pneumoniae]
FVILYMGRITFVDFVVLAAIFFAYVWKVRKTPKANNADEVEEPGPAAALTRLPIATQWTIMIGLVIVAC